MTTTTPATKIVIVSGQEFSVEATTKNEEIRQQLTTMGFADVASATIQTGKKTIDGVEYETLEFVKKAGTKGMDGAELAALLAVVPADVLPPRVSHIDARLCQRLRPFLFGELTFTEAVDAADELIAALDDYAIDVNRDRTAITRRNGGDTCHALAHLAPVAASVVPCGW